MEVKINVLNEMHKLRNTTYSDKYTWVDELIQNCQRSGATRIEVTLDEYEDKVVVSDNGCGCTNPQVLFEKNTSDWDEITTKNQSPFGEGFFSTMMAADTISVSSVGFDAVFDVKKMFEERTVHAIDIKPNTRTSGFTVTLTNLLPSMYMYQIEERFKETAKFIKSPTTKINGKLVNYEGLNPKNPHKFMHKINNEMFQGWIEPHAFGRDGYEDPTIKTFAYSRSIKDLTQFSGVQGIINFKDNTIGLRSPDRKEFIRDYRYDEMQAKLNDEIKQMYLKVIRKGTDVDIKDYQYYIKKYLDSYDYKSYIKFKFFNDNKSNTTVSIDNQPETNIVQSVLNNNDTTNNTLTNINQTPVRKHEDIHVETPITHRKRHVEQEKQTGKSIDKLKFGFYLKPDEIKLFSDAVDIATYYSIPIIEIRNQLEEECILEYEHIQHISALTDNITIKADFYYLYPKTESETRAIKVLNSLSKLICDNDNMFIISDTDSYKVLHVNGKEFKVEKLNTLATAYCGKIYINRKKMRGCSRMKTDNPQLTAADKKFLLLNLDTIAHEMSHVLYNTQDNTKEHFEKTNYLMQKIIEIIYKYKPQL